MGISVQSRGEKAGKMADDIYIGGRQLKNPKGAEVHSDTEAPATEPKNKLVKMDVSNPPPMNAVQERHSADPFEMHGIRSDVPRKPIGRYLPKDHPAIQVSEN
jgi:hypothetical protein